MLVIALLISLLFGKRVSLGRLVLSYQKRTISVSKTQILIWTLVTIFGIIYVHRVSAAFLDITPQVLILLGMGGITAIFAKYQATRNGADDQPTPQGEEATAEEQEPGQATSESKPSTFKNGKDDIFKFQMLSFTFLTAIIVFLEILKNNAFPVLPENLIVVMGISNGVYLGNKFTKTKKEKAKK